MQGAKVQGRLIGPLLMLALSLMLGTAADGQPALPDERLLVWQVGGAPGQLTTRGALLWVAPEQDMPLILTETPDEGPRTRQFSCGAGAVSADGAYLMTFAGANVGGLYRVPLLEALPLERWGDVHALACNGRGRAAFSPDGGRWAYLDYALDVTSQTYPDGVLRILDATRGVELASFANTVAFTLTGQGAYFVQLFASARGVAEEAVLNYWNGLDAIELATLRPMEGCDWRSTSLDHAPVRDEVALSLGEFCPGRSRWRLYTFSAEDGMQERVYMPSGGAYMPGAYINQVAYLPGEELVLALYPNGRASNIGNLVTVDLAERLVTLVTAEVTVDTFPAGVAGHMRFSPDGLALAFVSSTANGDHALHRLMLDGSRLPLTLSAGVRGDVISVYTFSPDGDLIYVAGAADGGDNALWVLSAGQDEPRRVLRGRFLRDVALTSGDQVWLLEFVPPDEDYPTRAANLVSVNLADGARTVWVDGRETGTTGYPLYLVHRATTTSRRINPVASAPVLAYHKVSGPRLKELKDGAGNERAAPAK